MKSSPKNISISICSLYWAPLCLQMAIIAAHKSGKFTSNLIKITQLSYYDLLIELSFYLHVSRKTLVICERREENQIYSFPL